MVKIKKRFYLSIEIVGHETITLRGQGGQADTVQYRCTVYITGVHCTLHCGDREVRRTGRDDGNILELEM